MKDVTATFKKAKGKHGEKETSTENYSKALKKKFVSIVGTPKWADVDRINKKKDGDDSDDEFFRETTDMLSNERQAFLEQGTLEYRKLNDINHESHNEGTVIRAAEFHPQAAVALVAGLNGTASLFKVDGKNNPKIQSVNFQDFPIKTAHFSANGEQFVLSSQHHSHFYSYDLQKGVTDKINLSKKITSNQGGLSRFEVDPSGRFWTFLGRFGEMHFINPKSKDVTFSVKMNDDVTAATFSPNGNEIYSHGGTVKNNMPSVPNCLLNQFLF